MNPIFFHNRHDANSVVLLESLPALTRVMDFFGDDQVPEGYKVSVLPYLITKELDLSSPLEVTVGTTTVIFNCKEYGLTIDDNASRFHIRIGDQIMDDMPVNGVLSLEIICETAAEVPISIINESDGYHPWSGAITFKEA